jgi:peptide/nickel transport system substrate-binding protein
MGMTRRRFAGMASASVAAAGLLAHPRHGMSAQSDRPIMRVGANASDVFNLDPHFSTTYQDWMVRDMVFNALIRYVPGDSTQFEPDIASEMPTAVSNDDGTQTWTFPLRDDVSVHASSQTEAYTLTADDVLFSLQKSGSPETSGFYQDYQDWVVEAVDDFTVTITLPQAQTETLFFPKIANYLCGHIVPRQPYEAIGADAFLMQPVGTGPFRFESHTPQNNVMLVAHDDYFRGAPLLGGIEVRFIADTTSRELALQSGDMDVIAGLPDSHWVNRFAENPDIDVDVFGVGEVLSLHLNIQHDILQDVRVREAIVLAVSRIEHANLASEPVSKIVYSVAPYDSVPGGLSEQDAADRGVLFPQDLERARELLAEAGYPEGFEMSLVSSELPIYRQHYEILAEELRQIGIDVSLEVVQHAAMHELIREGRNPVVFYPTFRPSVDFYLTHFFTSESGVVGFSKYTVDGLRDEARAETDPDRQVEIWKEALAELQANFAVKALMYNNNVYARSSAVDYGHDVKLSIQLYPNFTETTTVNQ